MIEYKLTLAGCECSVAEWNPSGTVIVFAFHGWLDNLATFESLAVAMPEIKIIAIDSPGHGHSAHIEQGKAYHFIDGVFVIDDLIEHFKCSKINLLGHSMGGAIATIYAAVQSNRVNKLILIEALGPVTSEVKETPIALNKAISQRRALKDKKKPVYTTFNDALNVRAAVSEIEPELIKPLVERALTNINGGYTWRADSRLRIPSTIRMSEEQLRCVITNITAETLLIEAKSGLLQAKNAKHIQERKPLLKNLKTCLLEGGHHLHLESPTEIGQLIKKFLL
jgi:pimeloyl-ACP methyl ester carboxylesterase